MKILVKKLVIILCKLLKLNFKMPKLVFKKLKLVSKMQKLPSPAFPLQVLGWKSHKKFACIEFQKTEAFKAP